MEECEANIRMCRRIEQLIDTYGLCRMEKVVEQNDAVASWSDATITKLKQIIARVLVETEYLDNLKADHLNPVWLHPVLENAIRGNGDTAILPAFNCFS